VSLLLNRLAESDLDLTVVADFIPQLVVVTPPVTVRFGEIPARALASIDFPLRFNPDCDLARCRDERGIENNLRTSILVLLTGIPLFAKFGSLVPLMPFDPNDIVQHELISDAILTAAAFGEPRALIDQNTMIVTDESNNIAGLAVPYQYRNSMQGWNMLTITDPSVKAVDK